MNVIVLKRISLICLIIFTGGTLFSAQKWQKWETSLSSSQTYSNPYKDIIAHIEYTSPTGKKVNSRGFWDGGNIFRFRAAFNETGNWTELDRFVFGINDPQTSVWFKTQEPIDKNMSDTRYYLYYGNNTASNPPDAGIWSASL